MNQRILPGGKADFAKDIAEFLNRVRDCSFVRRVAQAYLNQKKLDTEAKQLHAHSQQLLRQTEQWTSLLDNFHRTLKEIGDVENWAKIIETDMNTISSALEYAYNGQYNKLRISSTSVHLRSE